MHNTAAFGRALNPIEMQQSRYLDAMIAFRPSTCLRMEDEPDAAAKAAADAATKDAADAKAAADKAAADKAATDTPSKGFPADTPVAEMKPAEQAAYWRDKAQKHETRNRELMAITGGKHGDELRKEMEELGTLRKEKLTPSEQAIEDAKAAARGEILPQLAETAFRVAIGDRKTESEVDEFIADLNLSRFIKDGKVDTAKVIERVQQYAPAKDTGTSHRDYGQGNRRTGTGKTGVSAGADMFAERRNKKSTTAS